MFSKKTMSVWVGIMMVAGMFLMGQDSWGPVLECVDFEDPGLGSVYNSGMTFTDSGADVIVGPFQWSNGVWTSMGNAEIVDSAAGWCDAGGSDQELLVNNVNVEFVFPASIDNGLTILFAEHGGNVNLMINGIHMNRPNFGDMPLSIGGVNVTCVGPGCAGGGQGELKLEGAINEFYFGGQEYCVDDICPIL